MYYSRSIQEAQSIEQLLCKHSYERSTEATKLILLDQFVQIHTEEFKDKTQMLSMNERVFKS